MKVKQILKIVMTLAITFANAPLVFSQSSPGEEWVSLGDYLKGKYVLNGLGTAYQLQDESEAAYLGVSSIAFKQQGKKNSGKGNLNIGEFSGWNEKTGDPTFNWTTVTGKFDLKKGHETIVKGKDIPQNKDGWQVYPLEPNSYILSVNELKNGLETEIFSNIYVLPNNQSLVAQQKEMKKAAKMIAQIGPFYIDEDITPTPSRPSGPSGPSRPSRPRIDIHPIDSPDGSVKGNAVKYRSEEVPVGKYEYSTPDGLKFESLLLDFSLVLPNGDIIESDEDVKYNKNNEYNLKNYIQSYKVASDDAYRQGKSGKLGYYVPLYKLVLEEDSFITIGYNGEGWPYSDPSKDFNRLALFNYYKGGDRNSKKVLSFSEYGVINSFKNYLNKLYDISTSQAYAITKNGLVPNGIVIGDVYLDIPLIADKSEGGKYIYSNGDYIGKDEFKITFPDGSVIKGGGFIEDEGLKGDNITIYFFDGDKFEGYLSPNGSSSFIDSYFSGGKEALDKLFEISMNDQEVVGAGQQRGGLPFYRGTYTKANGKSYETVDGLNMTALKANKSKKFEEELKKQEAILKKMNATYGAATVQKAQDGEFEVGMPMSLIEKCHYANKIHQTTSYTWYSVTDFKHVKYLKVSNSSGKVIAVSSRRPIVY